MSFYNENYSINQQQNVADTNYSFSWQNRILEVINYPIIHRCPELALIFNQCSLRELEDAFPLLINSIFNSNGGVGWGLRTISKETNMQEFEVLYNFFVPYGGPFINLCYRLLNEAIKFEMNVDLLPVKMNEMLNGRQYPIFYADLINFDANRRCCSSLSLNAFDYFMLNFALYGTNSLHRTSQAALTIHNEKLKTVYFFLSADYLCCFLPSDPDAVVLPTNICHNVKTPIAAQVQPMQPTCTPKYLVLSPKSHFPAANQAHMRPPESPREHEWRTESILYLFVDTWLLYDVEETVDLPSSEFVRVVRVLVKQLHAFGNSAEFHNCTMPILRKLSQPLMSARIYYFLKSIITRWPLDSSLIVVLELWLSYLQPWRYTFRRTLNNSMADITIDSKYDGFLAENLVIYTQIFIQLLPRFKRLDFLSIKNVQMIHRLIKVFNQSNISEMLRINEEKFTSGIYATEMSHQPSPKRSLPYSLQMTTDQTLNWTSFHPDNVLIDENYVCMFGAEVRGEVEGLVHKLLTTKMHNYKLIYQIEREVQKETEGIFNNLKHILMKIFDETSANEMKLMEFKRISELLDFGITWLCSIFQLNVPDTILSEAETQNPVDPNMNSNMLNVSPIRMREAIFNQEFAMDPATLPVQSNEVRILVRLLHKLSAYLNETYMTDIKATWDRDDIYGKFARQVLSPPVLVQSFDKSKGIPELKKTQLPPRINLRFLASHRTIGLICLSFLFGYLIWGVSILGFFLFLLITLLYKFVRAITS